MSNQVRAMYYPGMTLTIDQTPYGMTVTSPISLYQQPVRGKAILKVDLLTVVAQKWGTNMTLNRNSVWCLVSGMGVTEAQYRELLLSCYRRFAAFANYCDDCYYFGDYHLSLHARFLAPIQALINEYREQVSTKGRVLAEDEGYLYISCDPSHIPTDIEGVVAKYV